MRHLTQAFKDAPLRIKIVSIIGLICLFVLGTAIAGFAIYDRISYKNNMVAEQRVLAAIIAERSAAAVAFGDTTNALANLKALGANRTIASACIYQQDNVFALYLADTSKTNTHNTLCPSFSPPINDFQFTEHFLKIKVPIMLNEKMIGELYMVSTLVSLEERTANFLLIGLLLLMVAGSIGLILAYQLISAATRPLSQLENTAKTIQLEADFSVRSEKQYDDDIGLLIDTFNNMLDTIEHQNNALRDSEETLKTIINDAPDLMQIVDKDGNISFINRNNNTKYSEANIFQSLKGEQLKAARMAIHKVFNDGATAEYESIEPLTGKCYANHLGPLRENGEIKSALVMKRDISALKNAHEKLSRIAFYDPLTGLPNRRLFKDHLADALETCSSEHQVALMFIDLDNFKHINDTLGHEAGDQLLVTVANRLSSCIDERHFICRLGGDEFTVVLNGLENENAALAIAKKTLEAMNTPVYISRESIQVTMNISPSIGIALGPQHGATPKALMHSADVAMYRAKALGKNTYQLYEESMSQDESGSKLIEKELLDAIHDNQFQIYYQPQISVETSEIVGIEALLRWHHPEKGLLQPDYFIEKIETNGLMMELTKWTLHTACREINQVGDLTNKLKDIRLAINLSARQFRDPKLVEFIDNILQETQFPPELLELEITETSLVTDLKESISTMQALRDLGISLSIDDFGTGYSSLNYLRQLPINFLKIDRSFITELPGNQDDREITTAVIAMAHNLRLGVLAEGVESAEQLEFLKQHGCDCAQGFYISPPVPVNALAVLNGSDSAMSAEKLRENMRLI